MTSADTQAGYAVEVEGVTFGYDLGAVLWDVDVSISPGEFVSLIGPSGCGKSTLLKIMAGLITPQRGRIRLYGRDIERPGAPEQAMVFQHFALMPWKTVIENVAMGLKFRRHGLSRTELVERCHRYVELVGLKGYEKAYPYQLSGGMRQRVGLARAFVVDAQVMLMDEPFGALDAQTAELMREEVRELVRLERKTAVFVTHSLDEALYLSDRVLMMTTGPGMIAEDVRLDLPRDRKTIEQDDAAKLRLSEYRQRLWGHLKREVLRSRGLDTDGLSEEGT